MKNGSSLPGAKMHSIPVPASRSSAMSIQRLIVSVHQLAEQLVDGGRVVAQRGHLVRRHRVRVEAGVGDELVQPGQPVGVDDRACGRRGARRTGPGASSTTGTIILPVMSPPITTASTP